jgi:site-specific recombinase XerD
MASAQEKPKRTYKLTDLIEYYEISNRAEGKSEKTCTWYTKNLIDFRKWNIRSSHSDTIDGIDTKTIRLYVLYLMKKRRFENHPTHPETKELLSISTVHGHVRTLRAFLSWMFREGFTETNIGRDVNPPKLVQKVVSPLSDDEISSIIRAFDSNGRTQFRDQVIFMLLIDTGLRVGELTNLKINDVNGSQGILKVLGKGKKERLVPMGNKSLRALQRYLYRFRREPLNPEIQHVFLSEYGEPLTNNGVRLSFRRLAIRSGVHRIHPHLCRHTFATRYLLNGGDIFTLQIILGHSTLEMVRHYVNIASSQVAMKHHEFSPLDRFGKVH